MNGLPQAEWIALLGRRDTPTDALRDYCEFLSAALDCRGIRMALVSAPWAEGGWIRACLQLWRSAGNWKNRWVLVQYTALSWSRRGFPFGAIAVVAVLRLRGARTAIVFHDWSAYPGTRPVDRLRRACQLWSMRRLASLAERYVFPVRIERISWLPGTAASAAFIPIGANLPSPAAREAGPNLACSNENDPHTRTVVVYGVTGGRRGETEVEAIAAAVRQVAARLPGIRLVVLGRGSDERRAALEQALNGSPVELSVLGLLPAEEVARRISIADASLFVRGELSGQRGSAIAAIACGVPLIGFGDSQRAFPLSEAGVSFVRPGDNGALAESLERVLTDGKLRLDLRERNRRAQAEYFCWDRIAARFSETLNT